MLYTYAKCTVHTVSRWYEGFSISFTDKMQRIGGDTCAIYHSNNLYAACPYGQFERTIEMYTS